MFSVVCSALSQRFRGSVCHMKHEGIVKRAIELAPSDSPSAPSVCRGDHWWDGLQPKQSEPVDRQHCGALSDNTSQAGEAFQVYR